METGKVQAYELSFRVEIVEDQEGAEEFAEGMIRDTLEHLVNDEKIILISVEKIDDKARKNKR